MKALDKNSESQDRRQWHKYRAIQIDVREHESSNLKVTYWLH